MADEPETVPTDEPQEAEEQEVMPPEQQEVLPEKGQEEMQTKEQGEEQKELQEEEQTTQEAPQPLEVAAVGDSKEVKNSTNCQASCNQENLNKVQSKKEIKAPITFADKNTENPPGPDIHGINPMQENLCLMLNSVKNLTLEVQPIQEVKANQVLLQMEVVGICGSDVHYYVDGKIGHFVVNAPMIMGHEASGTVVKCGPNVTGLKPGDRVAIEPQIPCRECDYCKTGKYNLCEKLFFCATPPDHGNLRRYYVHDADFCYKLPDNMDFEHGTLMEPLAVGVHACTKLEVTCGDYLLILGAGPIGLVTMFAGKAMGASKIIMTEIDDAKVKKALELGADYALNISGMSEEDMIKNIHAKLGKEPNKTVDCCGDSKAIRAGIKATKSGGKFAAVGMGSDDVSVPYTDFLIREVDLIGIFRYVNNYPTAIEMVASGKVNPKPLITHHFKMEDSIKAFEMAANQQEPFIKILIHANPFWDPSRIDKHPSQLASVHPIAAEASPQPTGPLAQVPSTEVAATEVAAPEVAATEVAAPEVAAPEAAATEGAPAEDPKEVPVEAADNPPATTEAEEIISAEPTDAAVAPPTEESDAPPPEAAVAEEPTEEA